MAIYHCSMKPIARSSGRSAVAAAAYRSAECLVNVRDGVVHDYRTKAGVCHSEIILPEESKAEWALDRSVLWNAAEAAESRKNARTADEFEIALPHELSAKERIDLAQEFAQFLANRYNAVVDMSLHEPQGNSDIRNHHAHLLMTTREVSVDGFGPKIELEWRNSYLLEAGRATAPMQIREIRESFAAISNRHLAKAGHDVQIDHRSHKTRGLTIEPTLHMGVHATQMERHGIEVERVRLEREAAERNREILLRDPANALQLVTDERSVFTRHDVAAVLHRYLPSDEMAFRNAFAVAMASPELVELQAARKGPDGPDRGGGPELARYSTCEMLLIEQGLAAGASRLAEASSHPVDRFHVEVATERQSEILRQRAEREGKTSTGLSAEQRAAIRHVTGPVPIASAVGFAGSGKSTMLSAAREAWEAQGYHVHGAALSGKAAEGLQGSSGIASRTLASWEMSWEKGYSPLGPRDVFVIDEAGMVGSRQMAGFVAEIERAGAKLVLVGDHEQLQAIGAGAPFRCIIERTGFAELSEIRRQHEEWQREASRQFATHCTAEALAAYERHGAVQFAPGAVAARAALVADYLHYRTQHPDESLVAMAHRRVDVHAMNAGVRDGLQVAGLLARCEGENVRADRADLFGRERVYETIEGPRAFAPGDRIVFLDNNRDLGVKNGMLGSVVNVEPNAIQVRLDDHGAGKEGHAAGEITIPTDRYRSFDHGYATTIHKTQGATVNRAFVLASTTMDRHLSYVAMTRHRDDVGLYASQAEFKSFAALQATLGRDGSKEMAIDYLDRPAPSAHLATKDFAERRGIAEAFGIRSTIEIALHRARTFAQETVAAYSQPYVVMPTVEPQRSIPDMAPRFGEAPRFEPPRFSLDAGQRTERVPSTFQPPRFALEPSADLSQAARHLPATLSTSPLMEALERWARAHDVVRPALERGLEPLIGDRRVLAEAEAALDRLSPGTQERLLSALRYDTGTAAALCELRGPERTAALHAGLGREAQALLDPDIQADRFLRVWHEIDVRETALPSGWRGDSERKALRAERAELARTIEPGSVLERGLRARTAELGLGREISTGKALGEAIVQDLSRGRVIDIGYGY